MTSFSEFVQAAEEDSGYPLPLNQQHLQFRLPTGFVRIRRRPGEPAFDLLQRDRVGGRGFADVDVEDGGGADLLDPGIAAQALHAQDRRLVERFGLHIRAVANRAYVFEADGAGAEGTAR